MEATGSFFVFYIRFSGKSTIATSRTGKGRKNVKCVSFVVIALLLLFAITPTPTSRAHAQSVVETKLVEVPGRKHVLKLRGYYGPEPGQSRYVTNLKKDLEMNGSGKIAHYSQLKPIAMKTLAVDEEVIKPGTKLRLANDLIGQDGSVLLRKGSILIAQDKGGKIKGHKVDLFTGKNVAGLDRALNLPRNICLIELKTVKKTVAKALSS